MFNAQTENDSGARSFLPGRSVSSVGSGSRRGKALMAKIEFENVARSNSPNEEKEDANPLLVVRRRRRRRKSAMMLSSTRTPPARGLSGFSTWSEGEFQAFTEQLASEKESKKAKDAEDANSSPEQELGKPKCMRQMTAPVSPKDAQGRFGLAELKEHSEEAEGRTKNGGGRVGKGEAQKVGGEREREDWYRGEDEDEGGLVANIAERFQLHNSHHQLREIQEGDISGPSDDESLPQDHTSPRTRFLNRKRSPKLWKAFSGSMVSVKSSISIDQEIQDALEDEHNLGSTVTNNGLAHRKFNLTGVVSDVKSAHSEVSRREEILQTQVTHLAGEVQRAIDQLEAKTEKLEAVEDELEKARAAQQAYEEELEVLKIHAIKARQHRRMMRTRISGKTDSDIAQGHCACVVS